jgi:hypothetical protein
MGAMQDLIEQFGGHVTVELAWLAFARMTLVPSGVVPGSVQWTESQKVFFGAWHGALEFQLHIIGHPGMSEEKGAAILQAQLDECEAFVERLRRG